MRAAAFATVLLAAWLAGCTGSGSPAEDGGDGAGGLDQPAPEAGILTGTLSATTEEEAVLPISVSAAGHGRLAATLVLTSNLPQTSLGLNVSGPDGQSTEVRTGPTLYVLPGGKPTMSFADPEVGDWAARVELRSGASADYEVHWCADHEDAPGPQDNLACHRDYS